MKKSVCGALILFALLAGTLGITSCSTKTTEPSIQTSDPGGDVPTIHDGIQLEEGATPGVSYVRNGDFYYVNGMGTATTTDLVISATCNGLPVTRVFIHDDTRITSMTIPGSVKDELSLSGCTALQTVKLGEGITTIADDAFRGCTALVSVELPGSLQTMGAAFVGCTSLQEVNIPAGVTGTLSGFSGCTSLSKVTLGNGITAIADGCFSDCSSLRTVTLGTGVTTIGGSAFSRCRALESIDIPAGVTYVGVPGSGRCVQLQSLRFGQPAGHAV